MKFTWSDQKSIILTRAVVAGTIAGCGIMTVSGPWLTRWMVSAHALPPASGPVLLGMGYVCAVLAFVMLVSLYKFLRRIEAGENCALCSDAGMPCVSDPGEVIVRDALARGIKVVPIPAASACVTALAVSGQDTSRWVFEGFLPVNRKQKKERLAALLQEKRTTIFYEAPHKLRTTLDDLANAFGADRSITLCRELTKLHEDIWKTTLGEAVEHYKTNEPRGEYVLVMAGAPETADPEQELTLEQAAHRALELTGQGFGPTAAAKAAAQGTPYSKSEVYKQLLVLQQGQQAGE